MIDTPMQTKGQESSGAMRDTLTPEGRERYGASVDAFRASLDRLGSRSAPPERVATAVLDALTARRPRPRVAVGTDAKLVSAVIRRLPTRLRDAVLGAMVKL